MLKRKACHASATRLLRAVRGLAWKQRLNAMLPCYCAPRAPIHVWYIPQANLDIDRYHRKHEMEIPVNELLPRCTSVGSRSRCVEAEVNCLGAEKCAANCPAQNTKHM